MSSIASATDPDSLAGAPAAERTTHWSALAMVGSVFILALTAFSAPGRVAPVTTESLDVIAYVKLALRLSVCLALSSLLFARIKHPATQRLVFYCSPIVLFVFWSIASTAWSPLKTVSLGQTLGFTTLVLLMIVIADRAGQDRRYLDWIVLSLACAFAIYSASVVIGYFYSPELLGLTRTVDGFYHPTNIGATASVGMVFVTVVWLLRTWSWAPLLLIISAPMHCFALAVANNRFSIILFVVISSVVSAWLARRRTLVVALLVVALAGTLTLVVDPNLASLDWFLSGSQSYMLRGQEVEQLSHLSGREEMWRAMFESFLESPWIGHGYFVSSSTGEIYVWFKDDNHTAHNAVLQVLVSTGIVGFTLIGLFVARLSADCVLANLHRSTRNEFSLLTMILLTWYAGWGVLNESIFGPVQPESVCFFAVAGIFLSQRMSSNRIEAPNKVESRIDQRLAQLPREVF